MTSVTYLCYHAYTFTTTMLTCLPACITTIYHGVKVSLLKG